MNNGVTRRRFSAPPISVEQSAFHANPLLAALRPEHLILREKRALVALRGSWPELLGGVAAFGRVLAIGRNPHAILGRMGPYPGLDVAACGHCAAGSDGMMEFQFRCWERAQVSIEPQTDGWLYAIEFFDACGEVLHKVCLTQDSHFAAFRAWVERFQGPPDVSATWFPERNSASLSFDDEHPLFRGEAAGAFLQAVVDESRAVRVVTGNDGMVLGHDMAPSTLRRAGQWVFAGDGECGLHLRTETLAEVRLRPLAWQTGERHHVLEAVEPEGRTVCVFAPSGERPASDWDEFLFRVTRPFLNPEN